MEFIMERKKFDFDLEEFLKRLDNEEIEGYYEVINKSSLQTRQKKALINLISNVNLSEVLLQGLAQKILLKEEEYYDSQVSRTDLIAKLAPMFGLVGTLIPLGPGLLALGEGDAMTISKSLLIAFDTTIIGLISAAISFVISKIRKKWYEEYILNIQLIMECILEKVGKNYVYKEQA